jgi:hypothetical protein
VLVVVVEGEDDVVGIGASVAAPGASTPASACLEGAGASAPPTAHAAGTDASTNAKTSSVRSERMPAAEQRRCHAMRAKSACSRSEGCRRALSVSSGAIANPP